MDGPVSPAVDLDSSPIQGQLASVVMDLDGNLVRGQLSSRDASLLYQMLLETANLQEIDDFQRMTVTFTNMRYVVARDQCYIYVVKSRAG
jgi:hypothetical protein